MLNLLIESQSHLDGDQDQLGGRPACHLPTDTRSPEHSLLDARESHQRKFGGTSEIGDLVRHRG
jgi:hypothetical protein